MEQTIYQLNGYENRRDYLESLAEDYGIDESIVFALAGALGKNEDFDGLISELEDIDEMGYADY